MEITNQNYWAFKMYGDCPWSVHDSAIGGQFGQKILIHSVLRRFGRSIKSIYFAINGRICIFNNIR